MNRIFQINLSFMKAFTTSLTLTALICALSACKEKTQNNTDIQNEDRTPSTEEGQEGVRVIAYTLHSREFLPPTGSIISQKSILNMDLTNTLGDSPHSTATTRAINKRLIESSITVESNTTLNAKVTKSENTATREYLDPKAEPETATKSGSLLGKEITLRKMKGTWVPSIKDEKSNPEAIAELEEWQSIFSLQKSYEMFGDTPRKVGDKWQIKTSALPSTKALEGKKDELLTISFERMTVIDGVKCAVFVIPFKLDLNQEGEEDNLVNLIEGTVKMYRSTEYCINMKVKFDASVKLTHGKKGEMQVVSEGLVSFGQTRTLELP